MPSLLNLYTISVVGTMAAPPNTMIAQLTPFLLLAFSSFAQGFPVVSILLPGFGDQKLLAEIIGQVEYSILGLYSKPLLIFSSNTARLLIS